MPPSINDIPDNLCWLYLFLLLLVKHSGTREEYYVYDDETMYNNYLHWPIEASPQWKNKVPITPNWKEINLRRQAQRKMGYLSRLGWNPKVRFLEWKVRYFQQKSREMSQNVARNISKMELRIQNQSKFSPAAGCKPYLGWFWEIDEKYYLRSNA